MKNVTIKNRRNVVSQVWLNDFFLLRTCRQNLKQQNYFIWQNTEKVDLLLSEY